MSRDIIFCKCPSLINEVQMESETTNLECLNYEKTVNTLEKRNINLITRRQYLTEKISTIEKTMPLLVAYNIWRSSNKDSKLFANKVRDVVNELSPYSRPDSVDKIIEKTKSYVNNLNTETTKLHEKIIEADMKLEESRMILESLQVVNNELDDKLDVIGNRSMKEINLFNSPLIKNDNLNFLSKLRNLIQQELRLKSCINALEDRENRTRMQLNCILSTTEQKNGLINKTIQSEHDYCECCKCDEQLPILSEES